MDEQQTSGDSGLQPLSNRERKGQMVLGGLLAGLGLSIAVALLMHVVQEASPIGYGINNNGSVAAVVLLAGPLFGLGLALALTPLVPDAVAPPRPAEPTEPADHPAQD